MAILDRPTFLWLLVVAVTSFALNFIWEHAHSVLYVHYKNGPITDFILFRATLGDVLFTLALSIPFYRVAFLRQRLWIAIPLGVTAAVALEMFALSSGRWAYNELMPIIPILETGLTPTIQLGLLGYISLLTTTFFIQKTPSH